MIRLIRVLRILRVFKMIRHFSGLQSLLYTLHQAWKELGVILIIVCIVLLMFSSLVYAFEQNGPNAHKWKFYDCILWSALTVTTVGYNLQPEVAACEKHLNRLHLILSQSGMGEMTSG